MSNKKTTNKFRAVVVTTSHRGVFFGYTTDKAQAEIVTLQKARNVVYWSQPTKGFVGLSVNGPAKGSRISPAADEMVLRNVTSVTNCTKEAIEAFERGEWA